MTAYAVDVTEADRALAAKLVARLPVVNLGRSVEEEVDGLFVVRLRHLARPKSVAIGKDELEQVPSGGVGIVVSFYKPVYAGPDDDLALRTRLGPGWTRALLAQRLATAIGKARERTRLHEKRDLVYLTLTTRDDPDRWGDEMAHAEAVTGHNSVVREMSEADCDFWLAWFAKP